MRWIFIILGLLCLPMSITAIEPQAIYFHKEAGVPELNEQLMDLLGQVDTILREYDYQIIFVDDPVEADMQINLLHFGQDQDDPRVGFILPIRPRSNILPSDILYESSVAGSLWYMDSRSVLEVLIGLSLYTVNDCENAIPHFIEAQIWAGQIGREAAFEHLNFFLGNCALVLEDYEAAYSYFLAAYKYTVRIMPANNPAIINYVWLAITQPQLFSVEDWNFDLTQLRPEVFPFHSFELSENWTPKEFIDVFTQYSCTERSCFHTSEMLDALSRRAQLYVLAFEYDSAITDINTAIALIDENPEFESELPYLYTLRGEMVLLLYEWGRAIDDFDTALEFDPDYAPAYFQRGVAHYTDLNPEAALSDFETYLQLDSEGDDATLAQQYIDLIQAELNALGGN